jgi:HAD superfamily hydrolase (TIGR01509 family)
VSEDRRAGVLLDVDGTLVDSNYLHTLAWSRAFHATGEWAPMNAIHRLIGMGGNSLVRELLGHESPCAEEERQRHYRGLIDEVQPFPKARDFLVRLHELGIAVVLASSAPRDELLPLVERLDAGPAIDAWTTSDDVASAKPAPDVFLTSIRLARIDAQRCLAVGDSVWDVQAARAAGIGCIGVESGGSSRHELSEAGAVHVYRDVEEVLDQLMTGPIRTLLP